MESRLGLLADYGFSRDVFAEATMETTDVARTKRLITMAIDSRAMVAVISPRGFGKTEAIRQVFDGRERVITAQLVSSESEAVRITDIERALVLDISAAMGVPETPKRSREVRARQVRRIVGDAATEGKMSVVLLLEETHRMHHSTLRSLKTLREMAWKGKAPLFTIIMVGQYDPLRNNPSVDEVRLRTDKIELKGLTAAEIKTYLGKTVGRVFEDDAVEAVSRIGGGNNKGQNFLDLQELLVNLMDKALQHGHKKVKAIDVFAFCGGGLKELRQKSGLSQGDIAREIGISTSEISQIENGKQGTISDGRAVSTRNAILSVVARKMGEKVVAEEAQQEVKAS